MVCRYLILLLCSVVASIPAFAQEISTIGEQRPFSLNGDLGVSSSAYGVSGIERRQQPFSWTINASSTASLYGVQLPFSFTFSSQDQNFQQPFNQFGISPTYKWLTLHLGYRSMYMSRYTLSGVTFLGAGLEANPGVVRLAAMYGRLQRAVEEDSTQPYNLPAYRRMGYAIKLGFGSNENYVDLSYLRAKDDTTSLTRIPAISGITPAENATFGLSTHVTIIPELTFDAEAGTSLLTRDLRADKLDAQDALPAFVTDFYNVNISTSLMFAFQTGLNFSIPHFGLRLGYERIEPGFNSLGAYYFTSDLQNWTIAPRFDLLDGQIQASGSIGIQSDNILHTKLSQTKRLIGSLNLGWNPDRIFGLDASYTNYATDQGAGLRPLNDTIRVRSVTQAASLVPHLLIETPELSHAITLIGSYQDYSDLNAFTNALSNNHALTGSILYNLTFLKENVSTGASILYLTASAPGVETKTIGGSLSGSTSFLEDKLPISGSLGLSRTSNSVSDATSTVLNETVNTSYRLSNNESLTLSLRATQNVGGALNIPDFKEFGAYMNYTRSFAWEP